MVLPRLSHEDIDHLRSAATGAAARAEPRTGVTASVRRRSRHGARWTPPPHDDSDAAVAARIRHRGRRPAGAVAIARGGFVTPHRDVAIARWNFVAPQWSVAIARRGFVTPQRGLVAPQWADRQSGPYEAFRPEGYGWCRRHLARRRARLRRAPGEVTRLSTACRPSRSRTATAARALRSPSFLRCESRGTSAACSAGTRTPAW